MSQDHAWLDGNLVISREIIADLDAHAVQEYPNESCGFLIGPASEPTRINRSVRTPNMADRYHKADPETFPRTAKTFFIIDARTIYTTFENGEKNGEPVKLIYHSHCDAGAYFSSEDRAAAAPDGELSYPVAYLVTSVNKGVVDTRKIFSYRNREWIEISFRVE